ncbi:unnamed protein product [Phytomonas sp. EM1]|nr:unnamed protein product [Phytomonas sp. EM1]|eukprot:CCW64396.1 unnamed protein product [Phytomonas sp. isolate EM1]
MSQSAYKRAVNIFLPMMGFAAGWGVFMYLDQNNLLSSGLQCWLKTNQLKMRLHLQSLLPTNFVEKYCYSESFLRDAISHLEKEGAQQPTQNRVTFDEILSQCGVKQQILYLEEHAMEDIPYFYIADVFHSWANIHKRAFLNHPSHLNDSGDVKQREHFASLPAPGDVAAFESQRLCEALRRKVEDGVIPFDVGVRALCVLAVRGKQNARWMLRQGFLSDLLRGYERYQQRLNDGVASDPGEVIPPYEVTAAMVALIKALHDASGRFRWFVIPGDAYPLARGVDVEQWCRLFFPINNTQTLTHASEPALALVGAMCEKLKCPERIHGGAVASDF